MEIIILLLAFPVIALGLWFFFSFRARVDQRYRLLTGELEKMCETTRGQMDFLREDFNVKVTGLNRSVIEILQKNSTDVASRFETSSRVFVDLKTSIAQIDESNRRILDLGSNIVELQNILRAPKPRGVLGEVLLEDLLSQVFPAGCFSMQHRFKKNDRIVDAIIKLDEGVIPVDAKFPLEYFNKMIAAQGEGQASEMRKLFIRMMKKHITDVSERYILPSEGTLDFALMYIPAESVYYEAVVRDETAGEPNSILQFAITKKVIPVSPNTFFAYLQTILFGLKGMKIEKEAKVIRKNLLKVEKDFSKFAGSFQLIGKNIERLKNSFNAADVRWEFLNQRIERTLSIEEGEIPSASASFKEHVDSNVATPDP